MSHFLVCPGCRGDLQQSQDGFACARCARDFHFIAGVPQFDAPKPRSAEDTPGKEERREYWDKGWEARYRGDHSDLAVLQTRADWENLLQQRFVPLRAGRHVLVTDAGPQTVKGKTVVDIGCGAGIQSATFGYFGARYIGVDHSSHAAAYALRHLRAVEGEGFTVQGNAEALPIRDNSIDVVYSSGVLHHTPNFTTAVDEAYRILKPGGKGIIALYSTYSTQYGLTRLIGIARGYVGRAARQRWMNRASEADWRTDDRLNPWTQTFSVAELRRLMRKYAITGLEFRKHGNPVAEVPRLGRRLIELGPFRALDRMLEPLLGGMIIMTFNKSTSPR